MRRFPGRTLSWTPPLLQAAGPQNPAPPATLVPPCKSGKHLETLETFQAAEKPGPSALKCSATACAACACTADAAAAQPTLFSAWTGDHQPAVLARALEDWQQLLEQALAAAACPMSASGSACGGRRLPADEPPRRAILPEPFQPPRPGHCRT